MRDDHRRWMEVALEEARFAGLEGEVPVGAVLTGADGRLLARGRNGSVALRDPTAHAEVLALRRGAAATGNYRLPGSTLYVTVEPCLMCAGALVWARVGRLVYGAPDPRLGAVDSRFRVLRDPGHPHAVEVIAGVLEDDCRALLQRFFEEKRDGWSGTQVGAGSGGEVPKRS